MSSIVYLIFKKCYLNQAKPGSRPLEIECVLKSSLKYTKATEHVATWVRNEKRCVFFGLLWSEFAFTPVRAFSTLYLEKRLRASFPLKTNFWQKLTRSKWRCGNVSDLDQTLWKFRIENCLKAPVSRCRDSWSLPVLTCGIASPHQCWRGDVRVRVSSTSILPSNLRELLVTRQKSTLQRSFFDRRAWEDGRHVSKKKSRGRTSSCSRLLATGAEIGEAGMDASICLSNM